jgi:hypothetical protein
MRIHEHVIEYFYTKGTFELDEQTPEVFFYLFVLQEEILVVASVRQMNTAITVPEEVFSSRSRHGEEEKQKRCQESNESQSDYFSTRYKTTPATPLPVSRHPCTKTGHGALSWKGLSL